MSRKPGAVQVCEAVQHAHQKGVIHRDLKPGNILVTEESGRPLSKVIDFGVAKATGRRLTRDTLVTTYGQALGTLAYMSPEQAEMGGLDVDTRADVYSLGVTLYQLLAGDVPLDPGELGAPTFLAQLIQRDHTMPTLSRHLSAVSGERLEMLARQRNTESRTLRRDLGGDLEWIVQKAMEKDRTRRYETVNGLAMDLRRHLAHEPVLARRPSASYRARKFVRRHRTGVAAASIAFLATTGGAVTATVGMVRAQRAEALASQEAATALQVSDFLVSLFRVSDPDEARGAQITAREILDRGALQVERDLAGEPLVRARLMHTIADVYQELGLFDEGERIARTALALRRDGLGPEHADVAATLSTLASLVEGRGDPVAAAAMYRDALEILEAVEPEHRLVARTINNLAGTYTRLADYDRALPMLERALALKEESFGSDHPEVASTLYNLAVLHRREERVDTAVALYRRSLVIRERALGSDHPAVARTVNGLAIAHTLLQQYDSAEALYRRSLAEKERNLGPLHPDLANSWNNLAVLYARQQRTADAESAFMRAYEIRLESLGPDHPDVGQSLNNLGIVYRTSGDLEQAAPAYRRAIAIYEQSLGPDHPRVAETLDNYAAVLRDLGRDAMAVSAEARASAIRAARGNDPTR